MAPPSGQDAFLSHPPGSLPLSLNLFSLYGSGEDADKKSNMCPFLILSCHSPLQLLSHFPISLFFDSKSDRGMHVNILNSIHSLPLKLV